MRDDSTNPDASNPIARGTLCRLLGGGVVRAYPDVVIGERWNGDYRVRSDDEVAWRGSVPRDQLEPLTMEERQAYDHARRAAV